jgi:hypothetical protein
MGFFGKIFGARTTCPRCGSRYARESFGGIKCPTHGCPNYERATSGQAGPELSRDVAGARPAGAKRDPAKGDQPVTFPDAVEVVYRNFREETRTFRGSRASIRKKKAHLTLCLEPTGRRVALRLDRIVNRDALQPLIPAQGNAPTANERRILMFHLRHGSTSARFEELRAKYPHWRPS